MGAVRLRLASVTPPWRVAAAGACGCVVVAIVDPTRHRLGPPCPFKMATGWWCPFCGATRAVGEVVRGDASRAFRYNAMLLLLAPLVLALWAAWAFPGRVGTLDAVFARLRPIVAVCAVALVAFTVLRNTPLGDTWLRYPNA